MKEYNFSVGTYDLNKDELVTMQIPENLKFARNQDCCRKDYNNYTTIFHTEKYKEWVEWLKDNTHPNVFYDELGDITILEISRVKTGTLDIPLTNLSDWMTKNNLRLSDYVLYFYEPLTLTEDIYCIVDINSLSDVKILHWRFIRNSKCDSVKDVIETSTKWVDWNHFIANLPLSGKKIIPKHRFSEIFNT